METGEESTSGSTASSVALLNSNGSNEHPEAHPVGGEYSRGNSQRTTAAYSCSLLTSELRTGPDPAHMPKARQRSLHARALLPAPLRVPSHLPQRTALNAPRTVLVLVLHMQHRRSEVSCSHAYRGPMHQHPDHALCAVPLRRSTI